MAEEYKCARCFGVFNKGWSDDEAFKEAIETNFEPHELNYPMATICDDCYNEWFLPLKQSS